MNTSAAALPNPSPQKSGQKWHDGPWIMFEETATEFIWACATCGNKVGFMKEADLLSQSRAHSKKWKPDPKKSPEENAAAEKEHVESFVLGPASNGVFEPAKLDLYAGDTCAERFERVAQESHDGELKDHVHKHTVPIAKLDAHPEAKLHAHITTKNRAKYGR